MEVKTLCLGALVFSDATGYEIRKMFESGTFSHFQKATYGSIYPALTRLTQEGLVICRMESRGKKREKKVYSLTPLGKKIFLEAISGPLTRDQFRSEFLFAMLFAHLLSPVRVQEIVENRIRDNKAMIDHFLSGENKTPGEQFVRDFGLAIHQSAMQFLKTHKNRAVEISACLPESAQNSISP